MAYSTKFSRDEIKKIGHRLHSARVLTGLNREEFTEKTNLPCMSIKNWEIGRALPRHDGVVSLLNALKECGVFVSLEWILYGSGVGVNYFETATFEKNEGAPNLLEQQINLFKKTQRSKGHNPIVMTIANDDMSPLFSQGDKLGAILVPEEYVRKKINASNRQTTWLVSSAEGLFTPSWLYWGNDRWFYNTIKHPELKECSSSSFALVKWHYLMEEEI